MPSVYFWYAATALARYRDNPTVMHIGGISFKSSDETVEKAYYFQTFLKFGGGQLGGEHGGAMIANLQGFQIL